MNLAKFACLLFLPAAALFAALPVLAGQERAKILQVTRVTTPPRIDGLIEDACWTSRPPVSGFFQHDPVNGAAAAEETLVWASYDQDHLYFAFLMKDSEPGRIWAELTPRNEYENNDDITVILDTYNDRRTSIEFTVNPRNVQKNTVETIWASGAVIRPDGWSAEIAIPFKSLRFSPADVQVWGVNFERYIPRLSERDFWTNVERDRPLLQQMGELRGLAGIRPGHNLEFFPYAGFRTSRWDGAEDSKVAAGLDVKYGFLPNVTLDLTASPDFSEVESDPFIYQLSPYENYFQENRPFFSEGSQYFRLAAEEEDYGEAGMSPFYSRRIDSPRFAAKVSGKTGGYAFGLLGAVNRRDDGPDRTFSVIRVQKDVFANSQVGVYYAGVDERGAFNRVFALDYTFNFADLYYLSGASAFSLASGGASRKNGLHVLSFRREPDAGLQVMFNFQRIEPNLIVRTGFVDRVDVQSSDLMVGHAWRFNKGNLRRFSFDFSGGIEQDSGGDLTGQTANVMVFSEFLSRLGVHGGFAVGRRRYQVRDGGDEGLVWTRDFLPTREAYVDFNWERGGFLKAISLEGGWEKRGVYNDDFTGVAPGAETAMEGQLTLRPLSNFEWAFGGDWIRQTVDRTGAKVFDGVAYETSLHYQVTTRLFLTTRLLGETREDQYNLDFLVGYYFGAGNIVQLSYKKSQRKEGFHHESGDSLTLKVSYLLRI
jgi:hypothetical protein